MTKSLYRTISLLLVFSLFADPVTVSAFFRTPHLFEQSHSSAFETQALTLALISVFVGGHMDPSQKNFFAMLPPPPAKVWTAPSRRKKTSKSSTELRALNLEKELEEFEVEQIALKLFQRAVQREKSLRTLLTKAEISPKRLDSVAERILKAQATVDHMTTIYSLYDFLAPEDADKLRDQLFGMVLGPEQRMRIQLRSQSALDRLEPMAPGLLLAHAESLFVMGDRDKPAQIAGRLVNEEAVIAHKAIGLLLRIFLKATTPAADERLLKREMQDNNDLLDDLQQQLALIKAHHLYSEELQKIMTDFDLERQAIAMLESKNKQVKDILVRIRFLKTITVKQQQLLYTTQNQAKKKGYRLPSELPTNRQYWPRRPRKVRTLAAAPAQDIQSVFLTPRSVQGGRDPRGIPGNDAALIRSAAYLRDLGYKDVTAHQVAALAGIPVNLLIGRGGFLKGHGISLRFLQRVVNNIQEEEISEAVRILSGFNADTHWKTVFTFLQVKTYPQWIQDHRQEYEALGVSYDPKPTAPPAGKETRRKSSRPQTPDKAEDDSRIKPLPAAAPKVSTLKFRLPNLSKIIEHRQSTEKFRDRLKGVPSQDMVPKDPALLEKLGLQRGERVFGFAGFIGDWLGAISELGVHVVYTDLDPVIVKWVRDHRKRSFKQPGKPLTSTIKVADPLKEPHQTDLYDWTFSYDPFPVSSNDEMPFVLMRSMLNTQGLLLVWCAGDDPRGLDTTARIYNVPLERHYPWIAHTQGKDTPLDRNAFGVVKIRSNPEARAKATQDLIVLDVLQSFEGNSLQALVRKIAQEGYSLSTEDLLQSFKRLEAIADSLREAHRLETQWANAEPAATPGVRDGSDSLLEFFNLTSDIDFLRIGVPLHVIRRLLAERKSGSFTNHADLYDRLAKRYRSGVVPPGSVEMTLQHVSSRFVPGETRVTAASTYAAALDRLKRSDEDDVSQMLRNIGKGPFKQADIVARIAKNVMRRVRKRGFDRFITLLDVAFIRPPILLALVAHLESAAVRASRDESMRMTTRAIHLFDELAEKPPIEIDDQTAPNTLEPWLRTTYQAAANRMSWMYQSDREVHLRTKHQLSVILSFIPEYQTGQQDAKVIATLDDVLHYRFDPFQDWFLSDKADEMTLGHLQVGAETYALLANDTPYGQQHTVVVGPNYRVQALEPGDLHDLLLITRAMGTNYEGSFQSWKGGASEKRFHSHLMRQFTPIWEALQSKQITIKKSDEKLGIVKGNISGWFVPVQWYQGTDPKSLDARIMQQINSLISQGVPYSLLYRFTPSGQFEVLVFQRSEYPESIQNTFPMFPISGGAVAAGGRISVSGPRPNWSAEEWGMATKHMADQLALFGNSSHPKPAAAPDTSPAQGLAIAIDKAFKAQSALLEPYPFEPLFASILPGTINAFTNLGTHYHQMWRPDEVPAIDESRRITKFYKRVPRNPNEMPAWIQSQIEQPAQNLVRAIIDAGHRPEFSNAYGPGLKGVWWSKSGTFDGPYYFTPLTPNDYTFPAVAPDDKKVKGTDLQSSLLAGAASAVLFGPHVDRIISNLPHFSLGFWLAIPAVFVAVLWMTHLATKKASLRTVLQAA